MSSIRHLLILLMTLSAGSAMAQESGETVNLRGNIGQDTYTAGGTIFSSAAIQGDLIASGGTLLIDGEISQDALLFSGDINIGGKVGDDLRAAGGTIVVNANVGDDVVIAGGQLHIGPKSVVGGQVMAAGGEITIDGQVNGDLYAAGGNITLAGEVLGDVELRGGQITLLEGAHIAGNLNYSSPEEADIHPQARVDGSITYSPSEWEEPRGENIFFMATLAVGAIVFYLLFPAFSTGSSSVAQNEFWKSLGFGFVMLLVVPFIAIFAMTIVVGLWLGLVLLALYFVSLVIGSILGMFFLSTLLARLIRWDVSSRGRRVLVLLGAFVLLGLVQLIPFLGGLATFLLLLLGLGAGTIVLFRRYIASPSAEAI